MIFIFIYLFIFANLAIEVARLFGSSIQVNGLMIVALKAWAVSLCSSCM